MTHINGSIQHGHERQTPAPLPQGLPPGSQPFPGFPGYYMTPFGEVVYSVTREVPGLYPGQTTTETKWESVPLSLLRQTMGDGGSRLASDDPRYWDLQYAQLYQDNIRMGLDAESARRQALTTLIANRNNTAVDVARTSADVAKTAAELAANPRDTFAEAYYRNQVEGSTPFGDLQNQHFDAYQKALADKVSSTLQPVAQDLDALRGYRDAPPPTEFYGPETRAQLSLPPTAAQALTGVQPAAAAAPATSTNPFAGATPEQLNALRVMADAPTDSRGQLQYGEDLKRWGAAAPQMMDGGSVSVGPRIDFGGVQRRAITNSEGGLNINVKHPAYVIDSVTGDIITTLAEPDPVTGEMQPEQLIVKPLRSVQARRRENEKAAKAMGMMARPAQLSMAGAGVRRMENGGSVTASPDDLMEQFTMLLQRLGGAYGGSATPLEGTRFLAGAPANAIEADPFLKGITEAAFSQRGVRPEQLWADLKKYTPSAPSYNTPRVSFA